VIRQEGQDPGSQQRGVAGLGERLLEQPGRFREVVLAGPAEMGQHLGVPGPGRGAVGQAPEERLGRGRIARDGEQAARVDQPPVHVLVPARGGQLGRQLEQFGGGGGGAAALGDHRRLV